MLFFPGNSNNNNNDDDDECERFSQFFALLKQQQERPAKFSFNLQFKYMNCMYLNK